MIVVGNNIIAKTPSRRLDYTVAKRFIGGKDLYGRRKIFTCRPKSKKKKKK